MDELKRNGEGYPDPTAYEAIKNVMTTSDEDYQRYRKTIGCLLRIAELSGFEIESRIVLRDKSTGKVWN